MYDFANGIAASEKFPGIIFSFETLDPTVLIDDAAMPDGEKLAVV